MIQRNEDRDVALAFLWWVRPRQEAREPNDLAARRTTLDAVQLDIVLLQQARRKLVLVCLDLRPRLLVDRVGEGRELVQGGEREADDASGVQTLPQRAE